jgi:hypothetical protein
MRVDYEMWLEHLDFYNEVTLFLERFWADNDTLQFFLHIVLVVLLVALGFSFRINGQLVDGLPAGQTWID